MKKTFYPFFLVFFNFIAFHGLQPNTGVTKDPLLVIVLMVKDEASVICQTLQPFIDEGLGDFLIFDTGSTDDTVAVTRKFFEKHHLSNAVIKQEPFIDFSISRNRALQLAEEAFPQACFMLMLDAEWYMHNVNSLVKFCALHKDETEASYLVRIIGTNLDFYTARLIRCRSNVRFVGPVHEVLNQVSKGKVPADCFFELRVTEYGQEKSRKRWTRDSKILLKEHDLNPSDPRTVFYLAQTYACLGDWENARLWYERRTEMPGWDEENFMAYYKLAQVYEALGNGDQVVLNYLRAFSLRPWRAEPLVCLARHYWEAGDNALCCLFAQYAADLPYPENDVLFIEKNLYDVERHDLLGRSAWYVGKYDVGKRAVEKALKARPTAQYLQDNLAYYCASSASPT